jgi:hypothetical protein
MATKQTPKEPERPISRYWSVVRVSNAFSPADLDKYFSRVGSLKHNDRSFIEYLRIRKGFEKKRFSNGLYIIDLFDDSVLSDTLSFRDSGIVRLRMKEDDDFIESFRRRLYGPNHNSCFFIPASYKTDLWFPRRMITLSAIIKQEQAQVRSRG